MFFFVFFCRFCHQYTVFVLVNSGVIGFSRFLLKERSGFPFDAHSSELTIYLLTVKADTLSAKPNARKTVEILQNASR